MAQSVRKLSVFSLSAIDLFSCAFGGLVLILILFISQSSVRSQRDEPFCVVTISVHHWAKDTSSYTQTFLLNEKTVTPKKPQERAEESGDAFLIHAEAVSPSDRRSFDKLAGTPVRRIETAVFRLTSLSEDPLVRWEIDDTGVLGAARTSGRRGMSTTLPTRVDLAVYSSQRDEFASPIFRSFYLNGGSIPALAEADFGTLSLAIRLSGEYAEPVHSVTLSNKNEVVLRLTARDLQKDTGQ